MPITTVATGYSYILIDQTMTASSKIAYSLNDSTTTATNVGNSPVFWGPTGNYDKLIRWSFEI